MSHSDVFVARGWRITSPYGERLDPITRRESFHRGIDLAKTHRHPVEAFIPGTVLFSGWGATGSGLGGYGTVVFLGDEHGYGHVYAHLDETTVSVGNAVRKGETIGLQGATGRVTGSHLHYEVRRENDPYWGWETDVDPGLYFNAWLQINNEPNALLSWERDMGEEGIRVLVEEGLLYKPEAWESQLDQPVPYWLFWTMLARTVKHRKEDNA